MASSSSIASSSSPPLSLHNVFVYGSLLADEVVHVLLNRLPPSSHASLNGYHRFSIKGRVYPAILPVESKKVTGKVLMGITDPELVVLDTFEDVEYLRRTVEISLIDSSETLLADTYVWGNQDDPDLYGDWDFEEWKRLHMKDFLAMTKGFMEELEQPESKTRVATYESFFQKESRQSIAYTEDVQHQKAADLCAASHAVAG
ncbi:AIG2-like protein D isoform X1 [Ananas comosus]|uniref:Putative gamma-glutamylcyclotransferase n=1 Tax=Ananas comosus TaxID=4615 RepID=A0A6P5F2I0_ANACO|nr:AIG2-like protein D isoform X1 [Ananas comosus]